MVQLEHSTKSSVMLLILPISPCHMHKIAGCVNSSSPARDRRQTVCDNPSLVLISECVQQTPWNLQCFCVTEKFPVYSSEIISSNLSLPIPDHPHVHLIFPSICLPLLFLTLSLWRSTNDVLPRSDWPTGNFCGLDSLTLTFSDILCSSQLGGSETEADTVCSLTQLPSPL